MIILYSYMDWSDSSVKLVDPFFRIVCQVGLSSLKTFGSQVINTWAPTERLLPGSWFGASGEQLSGDWYCFSMRWGGESRESGASLWDCVNALFYLDHCRHINGCASFIIILPGLKSGRFIKCLNEETCALVAGQHQQQRGWGMVLFHVAPPPWCFIVACAMWPHKLSMAYA